MNKGIIITPIIFPFFVAFLVALFRFKEKKRNLLVGTAVIINMLITI